MWTGLSSSSLSLLIGIVSIDADDADCFGELSFCLFLFGDDIQPEYKGWFIVSKYVQKFIK